MTSQPRDASPPPPVLTRFGLDAAALEPITAGLINRSWLARRGDQRFVLQRMSTIFPRESQLDTDAVTRHLEGRGLPTTRIVPDDTGSLYFEHDERIWRLLTYIEGVTRDTAENAAQAAEAGRVLAAFHKAVSDFDYTVQSRRRAVHELDRHVGNLRLALEAERAHREHAAVARLAEEILGQAASLPGVEPNAPRLVHGDPKISNVVFERGSDRAICLIDLDTLANMPVVFELGDALRSWCNEAAEDEPEARFSVAFFEAACEAYSRESGGLLAADEWRQIPTAAAVIALELAARFCADALEESHFAWDPSRFASASRHNQSRAHSQLALTRQIMAARTELEKIVAAAFARL